jgi:arylsulfatase A-like enzyme
LLRVLTLDTTHSDYLGAYGPHNSNTPVLDALAVHSTRYARALTQSPLTLPSHTSLMTGLDPPERGVRMLPEEFLEHLLHRGCV